MVELMKKVGAFFLDLIQVIVLALSIFVVVYLFLFQPHQVKGNSMVPNFHNGELLLTNKISYRFGEPQRGDVIIFKAPPGEPCAEIECEYIKRIIGIPGDRVEVQGGKVYVNGQKLDEQYLPKEYITTQGNYLQENREQVIPEDSYLALGDNRSHSRDGREFGPVEKESIVGKAWLRYWPVNVLGFVSRPKYNL